MKVCIYGAGAIGLLIGARLAATGKHDVSAVARGMTLAALNEHGLRVDGFAGPISGPVRASADPAALGVQDVVVIAVKAPGLADVARRIAPLLGPHTLVVPAMNGVPWWFCQGLSGPAAGLALKSVDPDGGIAAHLPIDNVIGCVVHAAASVSEPGKAWNQMGRGLVIGEPRGGVSERVAALKTVLDEAGFETIASEMIQRDIWYKLWGNMTTNPISAITGATTDRVIGDELVRQLTSDAMLESGRIGERLGFAITQTPAERHAITRKLGAFKTSMLQDAEAGRAIELDSLVGAVRELGQHVGVATPLIDAIFGLARVFGQVHGLYPEAR
ncbi:2-dehydropantoate 2-reductase [Scleromatobacter humisilvae]|uniref:2-dehydropantoate 2-reductase n=1 Tax=Scleromatobacter humisilvae TaxID=2897159 RepID=A0A9X1YLR2_9BURK|nr:2-dehydropantoate 2-reductase [Scleromatobacter humisilvae]MCK9688649.1 2-dehydropantoate 2-reductase [Scleromatobacter humisilvae]